MEDVRKILTEEQRKLEQFEPTAKLLAATALSKTLGFYLERKYLSEISEKEIFSLDAKAFSAGDQSVSWLRIEQVGKPLKDSAEECFAAIQKILSSAFLPKKVQLLFLVNCESGICNLYLGIRALAKNADDFADSLENYIKGIWPGLNCKHVSIKDMKTISDKMTKGDRRYRNFASITGIPSMESQYKSVYPATVDKLIAGMNGRNFIYFVVADPMLENDIDDIVFQCHEIQGQAESVKSFNFAEGQSVGYTESLTKKLEKRDTLEDIKNIAVIAFTLAAVICPELSIVAAGSKFSAKLMNVGNVGSKGLSGLKRIIPFMHGSGNAGSNSQTTGYSTNQSNTISQNVVNKHIEAIAEQAGIHAKRYQTGKAIGCWNVSAYLMCENESDMDCASMQTKSVLSGQETIYEPIRIHNISDVVNENNVKENSFACFEAPKIDVTAEGDVFQHPFGREFQKLSTVLTTKELSYLINFPLRAVPGISVIDSSPDFNLNKQIVKDETKCLEVGKLLWSGSSTDIDIKLPIDTLCRHALVCGVNGSGKTNTLFGVLNGMLRAGRPFLVIEPAKTEYVDWAVKYNAEHSDKKIKIFIPGCEKYVKGDLIPDKLKLNPFEVIQTGKSEMRTISHIDRLKATFSAAFPMQDILPVVMEHLLYDLYEQAKLLDGAQQENVRFPQLSSVNRQFIDELMLNLGYAKENTQNIAAALRTRFSSLRHGWKGEMLDNQKITGMTWEDLFGSPVVINLSYAGDDQDRAFMMSLLLQMLYEYRIAESESGDYSFNDNVCRHLVVVEEAHRVMSKCDNPELPQYKSGQMFSNFLSEVRAYGQGMMVVDQVPSRLIEDAIKNTNVKIIHKLVAEDDASTLAQCIGLTDEQKKVIPKLSIGQALLAGFNSADVASRDSSAIYLAQINKMK